MNRQLNAYKQVENASLTGRELEATILTRAAARLASVKYDWAAKDRAEKLDESLKYNQRLWTLLQAELMDPENPLPKEVKSNLLTLSEFIDKRIFDVMAFPEPEKLDILIDINRKIAKGLRGEVSQIQSEGALA